MDRVYTKEEVIKLIENGIEPDYLIELIAGDYFRYYKIGNISMEEFVKQNKEEILEILNNLK